jgi:OOP family OmpA-OmpF porin
MNDAVSALNFLNKGGKAMKIKLTVFLMVLGFVLPGLLPAAEIITEEDIIKRVVVEEDFIKTADNFLILFDTSSSMAEYVDKGAKVTKYDIARKILKEKLALLPDLGYNAGLYTFAPYKVLYPMGPLDKGKYTQAVNKLPAQPKGATFLSKALRNIEPEIKGLSGKTVVFIFTDGTTDFAGAIKDPEDYTQALADKYNVCFYMIGDATNNRSQKRLTDMAKANACSRVIPFKQFVDNPNYITGALYIVKATERIETMTETRIVGIKVGDINFDFNKADVQSQYGADLDALGSFLKKTPNAYALLVGYTDSIGPEEYNLYLSNRRADGVADYLVNSLGVGRDQIVVNWYGEANPVASNDSAEGRAQNRRVEVAIGGM